MRFLGWTSLLLFALLPATTNYQLNSYGFGSGGVTNDSTATYALEGISGEFNGTTSSTSTYSAKPGFIQTQQANVPTVSLDNDSGIYYNELHFVINTQNNPTDATYLIQVSTDNFVTNFSYVQPSGTLTSTLSTADYQTYALWGGSSGSLITGLSPATTYYVRVRATRGKFTESAYSPVASQVTASPSITFALDTSTESTPPFTIGFGSLSAGSVTTASSTINTSVSSNAASGANVYIVGQNGGLLSSSTGDIISSVTTNLATAAKGFGAQNTSIGQTSGGPISVASPYNGTGTNVGTIGTTYQSLYTASSPITAGSGTLALLAKAASSDVYAPDYTEIITLTAAGNF